MYEVEVKVRADHEAVRERIEALDVRFRGAISQEDTYYDAPHRAFGETDEALRIRRETPTEADHESHEGADTDENGAETTVLTYKGPLVDSESKTRREAETRVGNGDEMGVILTALGFAPAATVSKERSVYTRAVEADADDVTVVLDRVAGLGEFVEVELEAEEDDIDAARERTHEVLHELELDPANQIRTSYLGLLLDKQDETDDRRSDGETNNAHE